METEQTIAKLNVDLNLESIYDSKITVEGDDKLLIVNDLALLSEYQGGDGPFLRLHLDRFSFRLSNHSIPENVNVVVLELPDSLHVQEAKIYIVVNGDYQILRCAGFELTINNGAFELELIVATESFNLVLKANGE